MPILRVAVIGRSRRVVMLKGNIRGFVVSDPAQRIPQLMRSEQ